MPTRQWSVCAAVAFVAKNVLTPTVIENRPTIAINATPMAILCQVFMYAQSYRKRATIGIVNSVDRQASSLKSTIPSWRRLG